MEKETELEELGEFALIDHLMQDVNINNSSTMKGVGDDAAVIEQMSECTLISTDMYVEGVHFDFTYVPLKHLGYKCVIGSISDIYAMNGRPEQILISLAVSSRFTMEMLDEIYEGIKIACNHYELDLVGGDTTSSKSGLIINVTVIGTAFEKEVVYRSGAQINDLLVVTGDLGGAYVGLQLLEREKRVLASAPGAQPELAGHDYILQKQLRPEARKDVIEIFKELKIQPTSMIDISDGLSSEAMHICKQSKVGCVIYEEKIPIDQSVYDTARKLGLDPGMCALNGGEDYELLFTLNPALHDKIQNHPDFTVIGYITEDNEGTTLITRSGNRYPMKAQGWKHF
jgi:thiamine-monophosphate kinase